jgi:hypothetical protein
MKSFAHQSLCTAAAVLATFCLTFAASTPPAIAAASPLMTIPA